MSGNWFRFKILVAAVVALLLGTVLRLTLVEWLGDEPVALAAVNLLGWFLLGLASGRWSLRVLWLRHFLSVLGFVAFTSWISLGESGTSTMAEVLVAFIELVVGLLIAVGGHMLGRPRPPAL